MLITLMLSLTCLSETTARPVTVYSTNSKGVTTKTSKLEIIKKETPTPKPTTQIIVQNNNYVKTVIIKKEETKKPETTTIRTYISTKTTIKK